MYPWPHLKIFSISGRTDLNERNRMGCVFEACKGFAQLDASKISFKFQFSKNTSRKIKKCYHLQRNDNKFLKVR